jgi:hypothetical protein
VTGIAPFSSIPTYWIIAPDPLAGCTLIEYVNGAISTASEDVAGAEIIGLLDTTWRFKVALVEYPSESKTKKWSTIGPGLSNFADSEKLKSLKSFTPQLE